MDDKEYEKYSQMGRECFEAASAEDQRDLMAGMMTLEILADQMNREQMKDALAGLAVLMTVTVFPSDEAREVADAMRERSGPLQAVMTVSDELSRALLSVYLGDDE